MTTDVCFDARYVLVDRISTGGMGEVWAARDELLQRPVAVKIIRPDLAEQASFARRFKGEARAAARLTHPGVVPVYDYGEHEGVAYLVMELIAGEPLSQRLRRGPLSPAQTMNLVAQAASALAAAHARDLIHRDVKPGNLLLQPDGRLRITDFGIARLDTDATRTAVGSMLGTVAYMSPEQVRGAPVTPASDLYSLGIVAYECLAGRRPFGGENAVETALRHLNDPVPPLPPTVPPAVAALVASLLAKDSAGRPANATEVARRARRLGQDRRLAGAATPATAVSPEADDTAGSVGAARGAPGAPMAQPAEGTAMWPAAVAPRPVADTHPPAVGAATQPLTAATEAAGVAPPPPVRARSRPRRRRLSWIAGAVAVLIVAGTVAGVAITGGGGAVRPGKASVPSVTGERTAAALRALRHLGLHGVTSTVNTPLVAAGRVAGQQPSPGTFLRPGALVELTVASGYAILRAGSLTGLAQATAVARLNQLGLTTAIHTAPSSAVTGSVLSFSPSGKLAVHSTVTLVVAVAIPPTTTTTVAPTTTTSTSTPATPTSTTAPTAPGPPGGVPPGHQPGHGNGHTDGTATNGTG